jgi:hypothetical protein
VRFSSPDGTVLSDQKYTLPAAPGEVVYTTQVPLYSAPNVPFPPGAYRMSASTEDGSGQSSVTVTIR